MWTKSGGVEKAGENPVENPGPPGPHTPIPNDDHILFFFLYPLESPVQSRLVSFSLPAVPGKPGGEKIFFPWLHKTVQLLLRFAL